jgi:hypothetical protein
MDDGPGELLASRATLRQQLGPDFLTSPHRATPARLSLAVDAPESRPGEGRCPPLPTMVPVSCSGAFHVSEQAVVGRDRMVKLHNRPQRMANGTSRGS